LKLPGGKKNKVIPINNKINEVELIEGLPQVGGTKSKNNISRLGKDSMEFEGGQDKDDPYNR